MNAGRIRLTTCENALWARQDNSAHPPGGLHRVTSESLDFLGLYQSKPISANSVLNDCTFHS